MQILSAPPPTLNVPEPSADRHFAEVLGVVLVLTMPFGVELHAASTAEFLGWISSVFDLVAGHVLTAVGAIFDLVAHLSGPFVE
jgi:hypothetical protein